MGLLGRKRKKAIKIIAIALVMAISLLLIMFHSGVAILERISGYVIYPILTVTDAAADGIGDFFASFGSRMRLREDLARAQEQLAQLENVESVAEEVKAENERLLALLGEKENYPRFSYTYAKVFVRSVDDYSATYTLNKGSLDGIEANMPVVAAGGLAGKIIKVTETTSVLLAITDSRCGVPALSESSRDMGVVKGISDAGVTQKYCTMTDLPANAIIKPGDTVVTSGMGEVYPKGIVVGKITEVSKSSATQTGSSARLAPGVDFDHLEHVLIITGTGE